MFKMNDLRALSPFFRADFTQKAVARSDRSGRHSNAVSSASVMRRARLLAMEPRLLFDGAAVSTELAIDTKEPIATSGGAHAPALPNRAPIPVKDNRGLFENEAIVNGQAILGNPWGDQADSDPDGDALCVAGAAAGRQALPSTTGVATEVRGQYGSLVIQSDGAYSYTPFAQAQVAPGEIVRETFTYTLCDARGATAVGYINIQMTGVGTIATGAPLARDDVRYVAEDAIISDGQVIRGDGYGDIIDIDPCGSALTLAGVTPGLASMVAAGNVDSAIAGQFGTLIMADDGAYTYQPGAGLGSLRLGDTVTDVFTYRIVNASGASAIAALRINIFGTEHAPVANDDLRVLNSASQSSLVGQAVLGNGVGDVADSDADGDSLLVCAVAPGVVDPSAGGVASDVTGVYGTLRMAANGNYTYALRPGVVISGGSGGTAAQDVFSYCVIDPSGRMDTATVTIRIDGSSGNGSSSDGTSGGSSGTGSTNRAPIAASDSRNTDQNTAIGDGQAIRGNSAGDVADRDPDGDPLIVQGVRAGIDQNVLSAGVATASAGQYGALTLQPDGSYRYQPNAAASALPAGSIVQDTFSYTISDGRGGTGTAQIVIGIAGRNDAPMANPDLNTVAATGAFAAGNVVLGNGGVGADTDVDSGDVLTIAGAGRAGAASGALGQPIQGQFGTLILAADGSYRYVLDTTTPAVAALASGAILNEVFNYTVRDGAGAVDSSTLTIAITGGTGSAVAGGTGAGGTTGGTTSGGTTPGGTTTAGGTTGTTTGADTGATPVVDPAAVAPGTAAAVPVPAPIVPFVVPAGFLGAVLGPTFVPGLARLSEVTNKPFPDVRFEQPGDTYTAPLTPEKVSGFVEEASDKDKLAAAPATAADSQKSAANAQAKSTRSGAVKDDCVDVIKSTATDRVKPKAVKRSVFAPRLGDGTKTFSDQVNQARKSFRPPAPVRPAVARDC